MWFSGSVSEAVDKSKREKKLFMVFIEGKDDVSKKMAEMLVNLRDDILTVMKREVVSFKVEDGTENCKLFGQIYPILMVPSVYFISNTGVNLEVIAGHVTEQEFMNSLDKVLLVHKTNVIVPSPIVSPSVATPLTQVQPAMEPVSPVSTSTTGDKVETSSGENSQPKLDEKVAKAQQLIEQLKLKKAKDDEEKARQQELERIRSGKEMAKAKARREELEMAELVKEREKEKREAAEARKRILAQIEADKEERRQRNEQFRVNSCSKSDPQSGTSSTPTPSIKTNVNEARIQFRFPDGSFKNQTFGADDPLCALRQFVIDTSAYRNFTLSTSYPKRLFTSDDLTKSLRDLELAPSSVLLVLTSPSVVSKASSLVSTNLFLQIWPLIMTPIYWIWTFITSLFRPPPPPPPPAPNRFSRSPSSSSQDQGDPLERKRALEEEREKRLAKRQKESKLLNRDGNVAQLRDNREDKDNEDGTWNGNSTQQM
ncbi:UBX domain-containing protein 4-like [Panonychus citri]|uniref:UBX domain-containing protein 4-like n=1 Tax=Panonychus citri TaxID=50023 RepID=UPI002308253F|nr:UBX domain-containing protein 4-like [Panonychus citri]